jgi:hypothetical protein
MKRRIPAPITSHHEFGKPDALTCQRSRYLDKEETTVNTFKVVKRVLAGSFIALVTVGVVPVFASPAQDVQAPRADEVQAPRAQDIQAPRGQEIQAPRGQDVQAPRGDEVQAPRAQAK